MMPIRDLQIGLAGLFLLMFAACGGSPEAAEPPAALDPALLDQMPPARSVRLGLQPFPHDTTAAAAEQAAAFVRVHSDLLFYHLDNGVPWPEALAGEPYHPNFLDDIESMASGRRPGQPLYLAITPNQPERSRLALYRAEGESMALPPAWEGKTFSDPDVIEAYLNHARFMIEELRPDYFAYGIEVTCDFQGLDDAALAEFLEFAGAVYPVLKSEYPDLPMFLTVCTGSFQHDQLDILQDLARSVLIYSDYVAISTYPYWIVPGLEIKQANPDELPQDWFEQWAGLDPGKPFAVAETAYPAEELDMTPVWGWRVRIDASQAWQARYVDFMLRSLEELDAEFVAWFVPRDYDQLYEWITAELGEVEFYKTWRDTGFLDGQGRARPSLAVWDAWLSLPYRTPLR